MYCNLSGTDLSQNLCIFFLLFFKLCFATLANRYKISPSGIGYNVTIMLFFLNKNGNLNFLAVFCLDFLNRKTVTGKVKHVSIVAIRPRSCHSTVNYGPVNYGPVNYGPVNYGPDGGLRFGRNLRPL